MPEQQIAQPQPEFTIASQLSIPINLQEYLLGQRDLMVFNDSNPSFSLSPGSINTIDLSRLPQFIRDSTVNITRVGSRVTVNPPPMDTDDDYLILTAFYQDTANWLLDNGWELGGSRDPQWNVESVNGVQGIWNSFRKDDINLIVTNSNEFYSKFRLAAAVCRRLNLASKQDRIIIHRAIMNGEESI